MVLRGDVSYVARPHIGMGVTQAAIEMARWLGAYMQLQIRSLSVQAAARSAMEVVAETAIDTDR